MKQGLLFLLLSLPFIHTAQNKFDCEQLAVDFLGIAKTENADQIILEVSNEVYTGTLYYYPGFVLLNENGDTIAKESVKYYGIGSNFQVHKLDLLEKIQFPFTGILELHGSYYQTKFCSFPIEVLDTDFISAKEIQAKRVKGIANFSNENLIIDLGAFNLNAEELDYYISVYNEDQREVFKTHINVSITSAIIKDLGGPGLYYISVWDNQRKELLPIKIIEIEE